MKHFLHLPILATTTLLLLLSHPITSTNAEDVLDAYGNPLIPGQNYYVVPYSKNDGGGFAWALKKEVSLCPHFYVQPLDDSDGYGEYTTFVPKSYRQNTITVSSDLNIMFSDISLPPPPPIICRSTSSYWLLYDDSTSGMFFVRLGGSLRNEESMFKIEKHEVHGYKIRYCPGQSYSYGYGYGDVAFLGDVVCGDLGVVYGYGGRWLGVNNTSPLAVMFV
ncbi:Kunitz trypsin inhibitor 2 [Bienertia sinuspersici]